MQLTLILQLQIALFIASLLLVISIIKILLQRKALYMYQQSTKLFKQSVNQYQESVKLFRQAIDEYEFLLQEHGIDTSKLKAKAPQQPTSSLPFQFKSLSSHSDKALPDLKKMKRQPSKPKVVSKNNPLYKELLNLLSGNEEIANRLITHQQQLNPNKLESWILEKVVGDIKRDRRV